MTAAEANENVKILARSPGSYPILVIQLPSGELCTAYFETDYDLERTKPVERDWLTENAIGRHSFVGVDPPVEKPADALADYVRSELLQN